MDHLFTLLNMQCLLYEKNNLVTINPSCLL